MDQATINSIEAQWIHLRSYLERAMADLAPDEIVIQPVAGVTMNHPAWILSHLSAYAPVLAGILRGEPVEDPINHRYGRESSPADSCDEYLPKDELVALFLHSYDDAVKALCASAPEVFTRANPVARWSKRFPVIGDMPVQFIVQHNAFHLGQLSAWRRAGGRPLV